LAVALPKDIRKKARDAYKLWQRDPKHRSLRMKKVDKEGDVWSGFAASLGITVFFLWLGIRYFRTTERTFADVI
jgi:hypothetical protein